MARHPAGPIPPGQFSGKDNFPPLSNFPAGCRKKHPRWARSEKHPRWARSERNCLMCSLEGRALSRPTFSIPHFEFLIRAAGAQTKSALTEQRPPVPERIRPRIRRREPHRPQKRSAEIYRPTLRDSDGGGKNRMPFFFDAQICAHTVDPAPGSARALGARFGASAESLAMQEVRRICASHPVSPGFLCRAGLSDTISSSGVEHWLEADAT